MARLRNQESQIRSEAFDADNLDIKERYGKDLPQPSPELKVSVVVPSSAEMNNDNFWRMLRSFLSQKNFDPKKFEILFVINNPQLAVESALGRTVTQWDLDDIHRQTRLNPTKLAERYRENQNQLEILKLIEAGQQMISSGQTENSTVEAIQTKLSKFQLTQYEQSLVFQSIQRGIRIYGIDASSDKKALNATKENNPVALSRHIGGHVAYDRLTQTAGETGLIDYLDADCFVSPQYIDSLIQRDLKHDYVIKPMQSVITEIPKSVQNPNHLQQFFTIAKYLRNHYDSFPFSYPSKSFDSEDTLGGPQIAISAEAFRSSNGYPLVQHDADFAFSQKLKDYHLEKEVVLSAQVYVADREREGSVDGSDRVGGQVGNIKEILTLIQWGSMVEVALKRDAYLEGSLSVSDRQEYRKLRKDRFRKESLARIFFIKHVERVLQLLLKKYEKSKSIQASDYLKPHFFNPQEKFFNSREIDYLQQNIVIVEAALSLFKLMESDPFTITELIGFNPEKRDLSKSKIALLALQAMIPEHFAAPPKGEPDYQYMLYKMGSLGLQKTLSEINSHDFVHLNMAINDFIQAHPDMKERVSAIG